MLLTNAQISPQKKYILGHGARCGLEPKLKIKINSELKSIHFVIEIKKPLKLLTPKNVWVLKFLTFLKILKKNFLKIFFYFSQFFRLKNLNVLRILNVC